MDQQDLGDAVQLALEEYNKPTVQAHYQSLTKYAHTQLESALAKINNERPVKDGLLARISSRTKDFQSLRDNVRLNRGPRSFTKWKSIRDAHPDLAGVRLTLYIPGEKSRQKADDLIRSLWANVRVSRGIEKGQDHENIAEDNHNYRPIHLGYQAVHYVISIKSGKAGEFVDETSNYKSCTGDKFEIQVVSALSHGWAEAQHDVAYKTAAYGTPTIAEWRILDAINGIVLSGDLLLEQFYELFWARVYQRFNDVESLTIFLRDLDILQNLDYEPFPEDCVPNLLRLLGAYDKNSPMATRECIKQQEPFNALQVNHFAKERFTDFASKLIDPKMRDFVRLADNLDKNCTQNLDFGNFPTAVEQGNAIRTVLIALRALTSDPDIILTIAKVDSKLLANKNRMTGLNRIHSPGRNILDLYQPYQHEEPQGPKAYHMTMDRLKIYIPPVWEWLQEHANDSNSFCGLLFRLTIRAGCWWFKASAIQEVAESYDDPNHRI